MSSRPVMNSRRQRLVQKSQNKSSSRGNNRSHPVSSVELNTNSTPMMQPRTVTPTSNYVSLSSVPSWEDYDQGLYGANAARKRTNSQRANRSIPTSAYMEDDEEVPMDELMAIKPSPSNSSSRASRESGSRRPVVERHIVETTPAKVTKPQAKVVQEPKSTSSSSSLQKLITALKEVNSAPPTDLSKEERLVWDTMQQTMATARHEQMKTFERELEASRRKESQLKGTLDEANTYIRKLKEKERNEIAANDNSKTLQLRLVQLQDELKGSKEALQKKEEEHQMEIRAIQRVLAEITTDRESEQREYERKLEQLQQGAPTAAATGDSVGRVAELEEKIKKIEAEKTNAKKALENKASRLLNLEREIKALKTKLVKGDGATSVASPEGHEGGEVKSLQMELEAQRDANEKLKTEIEMLKKHHGRPVPPLTKNSRGMVPPMTPPRADGAPVGGVTTAFSSDGSDSVISQLSTEEVEQMQKSLSETTSSLENAKKIITSLENANGSMAAELRAKLKAKEEDYMKVQAESADRKRLLDSLATELRDLQRKEGDLEFVEKRNKALIARHRSLSKKLEDGLSGLQSASVVHEVSTSSGEPDASNVEQISDILNDTMNALRVTVEMTHNFVDEFDDRTAASSSDKDGEGSSVGGDLDSDGLRHELKNKKTAIRKLEDALTKQNEELKRMRAELESHGNEDTKQLKAEIQRLREQCSTNMEVLAKKERELSVLRSSLKVDGNDTGYISDDASDGEDDENDGESLPPTRFNGFGAADTEALATILSVGGGSPDQQIVKNELLKAVREKDKATKELKAERESLANAKMIISSLEKANKSMMEDLRSRLQDSNTAIASLLDKSMELEKSSSSNREEVERLRKEKEELEKARQAEVKKMEEEIQALLTRLGAGGRRPSEEKKEDLEGVKKLAADI